MPAQDDGHQQRARPDSRAGVPSVTPRDEELDLVARQRAAVTFPGDESTARMESASISQSSSVGRLTASPRRLGRASGRPDTRRLPCARPRWPRIGCAGARDRRRRGCAVGLGTSARRAAARAADLIVHNAVVYTVNAAQPKARSRWPSAATGSRSSATTPARWRCGPDDARDRRRRPRGDSRPARRARPLHRSRRQPAADRSARHDLVRGDRRKGARARRQGAAGRMDSRPQLGSERLAEKRGRRARRWTRRRRTTRCT